MIQSEKVSYQRARQIVNPTPIIRQTIPKSTPFATLFDVELPHGAKRQLQNPWFIEKALKEHTGKTPRKCRGSPHDDDTFIIEVGSLEESRKMSTLEKIGNYEVTVQVNQNQNLNLKNGLIYIQGYDMMDFDEYKKDLMKDFNLSNVEHATWIKTKNSYCGSTSVLQRRTPQVYGYPGRNYDDSSPRIYTTAKPLQKMPQLRSLQESVQTRAGDVPQLHQYRTPAIIL